MKLQRGDYVYVGDLSDDEIQRLVDKFDAAGANNYVQRHTRQRQYPWLLWDDVNDVWCAPERLKDDQGKRQLTVDQVLGRPPEIQEGTDVVINKGRFYLVTTRELSPEEVAEAIKANL